MLKQPSSSGETENNPADLTENTWADNDTTRKPIQRAFRAASRHWRTVFDAFSHGVCLLSPQGYVVQCNRAAKVLLGLSDIEIRGRTWRELLDGTTEVRALFPSDVCKHAEDEDLFSRMTNHRRRQEAIVRCASFQHDEAKGQEERWFELTLDPLVDEEDHIIGAVQGISDITATKQAEEALRTSNERLRTLASNLSEAEESERQRLSRELHDVAGQELTALKIRLGLLRDDVLSVVDLHRAAQVSDSLEQLHQELTEAIAMLDGAWGAIRQLAHDLRPPTLDALGLSTALEGLCRDMSRQTCIEIRYHSDWDRALNASSYTDAAGICLFRFLQEALTNAVRHAEATCIDVVLRHDAEAISLCVKDNGKGFDLDHVRIASPDRRGIGLSTMQERLELLGGHLDILARPGKGTMLLASLPVEVGS
jgi:two-component system, NarL family, sensor histidine kinase UhpB